jgi:BMFP domain-containing protein YqiC
MQAKDARDTLERRVAALEAAMSQQAAAAAPAPAAAE